MELSSKKQIAPNLKICDKWTCPIFPSASYFALFHQIQINARVPANFTSENCKLFNMQQRCRECPENQPKPTSPFQTFREANDRRQKKLTCEPLLAELVGGLYKSH
jgi:hypothetical protein